VRFHRHQNNKQSAADKAPVAALTEAWAEKKIRMIPPTMG